jgi:hypothetical protein
MSGEVIRLAHRRREMWVRDRFPGSARRSS